MAPIPDVPLLSGEPERLPVPLDTRQISPRSYGAAVGAGLEQFGEGLDRYQAQADALAAEEQESVYAGEILQKVHGTGETDENGQLANPGFRSLKGHAALQASEPLTSELEARRQELAGALANDRQRRLFLSRSQGEFLGAKRAIEQHVGQEVSYLQEVGLRTRLSTATQNALAVVSPPLTADPAARTMPDLAAAQDQIDGARPWLEVDAEEVRGLKGADADRYVREQQGTIAVAVIERLLERPGTAAAARAFLDHNRDVVSEKDAYRFRAQLAAGDVRDQAIAESDRIWAEADGDPVKAMEGVRAIKDGELRDAVDQRIGRRLAQDHAVRVAADAPREGRLEQSLFQGQGLDRLSQDYQALSDEGKARIDAKAFAYQRSLRAEGSADRRAQNDADRAALAWFDALPLNGAQGRDQVSLDIEHAPELQGASPMARDVARKHQRLAADATQRGIAPNLAEFRSLVSTQGRSVLRSKEGQAQFAAYMQDWWQQQVDIGKGKLPDRAAVNAKMADALLYGDEKGGSLWASDQYKFQAERKGTPFVPFKPEEQKYAPNRPGASPPPGPVPRPSGPRPTPKVYRRVDPTTGEARVWNGSTWVPEGTR